MAAPVKLLRGDRRAWVDLCGDDAFRGRWVALEDVQYDAGMPLEGVVVDVDEELSSLCARMQRSDHGPCAILFCDPKASGIRRTPTP